MSAEHPGSAAMQWNNFLDYGSPDKHPEWSLQPETSTHTNQTGTCHNIAMVTVAELMVMFR